MGGERQLQSSQGKASRGTGKNLLKDIVRRKGGEHLYHCYYAVALTAKANGDGVQKEEIWRLSIGLEKKQGGRSKIELNHIHLASGERKKT